MACCRKLLRYRRAFYVAGDVGNIARMLQLLVRSCAIKQTYYHMPYLLSWRQYSSKIIFHSVRAISRTSISFGSPNTQSMSTCLRRAAVCQFHNVTDACRKGHVVLQVHIYEHFSKVLDTTLPSSLEFPHYVWYGAVQDLPLKWFECNAVQHERIIMMHVVSTQGRTATAIWYGNTWSYRGALINAGVQGIQR